MNAEITLEKATSFGLHGKVFLSVSEAYNQALHDAAPEDLAEEKDDENADE